MDVEMNDSEDTSREEPASAASDDVNGPQDSARRLRGGFDPREIGKRGGKRSGEVRRKRAEAKRDAAAAARNGLFAGLGEVDRGDRDRHSLEAIRDNPSSRDQGVIAAVRALRDLDRYGTAKTTPPSVERLRSLSTAELEALILDAMPESVPAGP